MGEVRTVARCRRPTSVEVAGAAAGSKATKAEKKSKEKDFLEMVSEVMEAGAFGVSAGRNIFQYKKPGNMIKAIGQIVHKGVSVPKAMAPMAWAPPMQ